MTQEELDALMDDTTTDAEALGDEPSEEIDNIIKEKDDSIPDGYNNDNAHQWPLPATDENKMVHQLDDVTKESEEKASEIFDIIEGISNDLMEKEENISSIVEVLVSNIELFSNLSVKFPDVKAFTEQLQKNEKALEEANQTIEVLQSSGDSIMSVMDIMQYQDIHRQKIERVINVMRSLSKYMNTLFEGKIDDENRVASAQHIAGDQNTDLASTDDIEALLAQFGN